MSKQDYLLLYGAYQIPRSSCIALPCLSLFETASLPSFSDYLFLSLVSQTESIRCSRSARLVKSRRTSCMS